VRFPRLLRDAEDLLFERGIDLCDETVRMWRNRFGPANGCIVSESRREMRFDTWPNTHMVRPTVHSTSDSRSSIREQFGDAHDLGQETLAFQIVSGGEGGIRYFDLYR
jgi:transposase-like protein